MKLRAAIILYRASYFKCAVKAKADFFGSVLEGLSGRVSSEVSSDVCMGEGSQILIRFGGAST